MGRATLRSLLAHKRRLVSIFLAVALGVALVAGTFILTDTVKKTFDTLFDDATAGVAVSVRTDSPFEQGLGEQGGTREPIPVSLLDTVAKVEGVRHAEGTITGYAQLVDKQGEAIAPQAPTFGTNLPENEELSALRLREGRRPHGPGEVVIDAATAEKHGFRVGDAVTVLLQGPARQFTVVGITGFGEADNLAGATMVSFDLPTAQAVMNRAGTVDSIDVSAEDGVSQETLQERVQAALPPGYQAITGQELGDENKQSVQEGLGFFTTFLLVFAFISLFVGSFIIFNTFSIIVAQRTREMALLRALGASRRQVTRSLLAEALIVSLLASLAGLALGVAVARGLIALLAAAGIDTPSGGIQFLPRTIVVSLVVGMGVTLLAALRPARRAGRVPPVAAMRETAFEVVGSLRRRMVSGGIVTALGAALLLGGLFGGLENGILLVGIGAMATFVGVAILSPVFAGPLARLIGAPFSRLFGLPGRLARDNAMRNPRRTASTAAALMIGIGLVGAVSVMTASMKASVSDIVNGNLRADYVLSGQGFASFSPEVAKRVAQAPGVQAVTGQRFGDWRLGEATKSVTGVDAATAERLVDFELEEGSVASLAGGGLLVDREAADDHGWKVGDAVPMTFARTGTRSLTIGGIFPQNPMLGAYVVSQATYEANFTDVLDFQVLVAGGERAGLEAALTAFPNIKLETRAQYVQSQEAQLDQLVGVIYALLGLAVIIALIGIVNTMALSILERTREIGLVRAVGMSRRQLRRMIRWESVTVSVLGAALGLVIGILFGTAVVTALADVGIATLRIPLGSMVGFVVLSAVAGMAAAVLPARRASRLDVLAAISHQ